MSGSRYCSFVIQDLHSPFEATTKFDGVNIEFLVAFERLHGRQNAMPHFSHIPYAFLRFNMPIKDICGLTREIIVGLVANLETHQQRKDDYSERELPSEHPRASSTDGEGIIALFHEVICVIFDTKEFYEELPKIMNKFSKKSDSNLPLYCWTAHHTHDTGTSHCPPLVSPPRMG